MCISHNKVVSVTPRAQFHQALREFPAVILRRITLQASTGCWLWHGYVHDMPRVMIKGRRRPAARAIYELLFFPLRHEVLLRQICTNRLCVNPYHRRRITRTENAREIHLMPPLAAKCRLITQCPQGHEYSAENTRVTAGKRHCRACDRNRKHRRKQFINQGVTQCQPNQEQSQ